jgi:hypothetical protein
MPDPLPEPADKHFVKSVLVPSWTPANVYGYDITADPEDPAYLPVATKLDNVGVTYPSLLVQFSSESSGSGGTTYDYVGPDGPGQNRSGQLLATARAEDKPRSDNSGYTADRQQYGSAQSEDITDAIIDEVERICQNNATGGGSSFQTLGSERGGDVADDDDVTPIVRLAGTDVFYSYLRRA